MTFIKNKNALKFLLPLPAILLLSCGPNGTANEGSNATDSGNVKDSVSKENKPDTAKTRAYANARFKEVRVTQTGDSTFSIEGKGQIFEANFSWVVEDGHYELKKGYQMTDAGAPEWGNFKFTITVQKQRPNSTLTLILFESSAKDGSRQHELPIRLY